MYSVYRSSVFSIASTASRRVYHNSIRSLKASVKPPSAANTEKAAAETAKKSSFAKENPFVFQLGVATAKTSAADLVAQIVAERKSLDEVDWKRNAIFVVFGFAYLGAFQYWLMVNKVNTTVWLFCGIVQFRFGGIAVVVLTFVESFFHHYDFISSDNGFRKYFGFFDG